MFVVVLSICWSGCARDGTDGERAERVIIPKKDRKPPASVVLLSRSPKGPSRTQLIAAAGRAWRDEDGQPRRITGMPLPMAGVGAGGDGGEEGKPVGPSLLMLLRSDPPLGLPAHSSVLVLVGEGHYDPLPASAGEHERKLWAEHKSWVSVELLEGSVDLKPAEADVLREKFYGVACHVAAELIDDDTVLVVLPREGIVRAVTEATKQSLASDDPLQALQQPAAP